MKKSYFKVAIILLASSIVFSSCIGSFSLFNNYAKWQRTMSDNKFVNAVVGFVLMPVVGSVCLVVDSLVLNSIEFWTGENPVASNVGKTLQIQGSDGLMYAVTTLKNGYEVKSPMGEVSYFIYDAKSKTWSYEQDGVTRKLFNFNEDGTITAVMPDGQELTVNPDQGGLYEIRMATSGVNYFAMR